MLKSFFTIVCACCSCFLARGGDDPFSEFSGETSVSLGYGYSENVLYSELAPVDAAFVVAGVEGVWERPLFEGSLDWNTMLFVEHRSFVSDEDIPEQTMALLQSQLEGYAGLASKWRIGGRYLSLEQAFDATFDELERNSFLVRAREPEFLLGWESFFWRFEYDAELGFSRMSFEQEGNDYDSVNWQLDFDQRIDEHWTWKSGFFGYDRDYLDREGRDLSGSAISESRLAMGELGLETGVAWQGRFAAADHKTSFMVAERQRRDGQLGYYDRDRQTLELWWQASWEKTRLSLQIDYGEYRYENQMGDDGLRERTDAWACSLDLDRSLGDAWAVFLSLENEREDSNASFSSYDSNSVSIGMKWLK